MGIHWLGGHHVRPAPPPGPVLLLPPKEGPLDNFHISSKFGDFRQCWEAWLKLPEAHVEVIKAERGSGGKEGWGKRGGGEQARAGNPGPSRPEKVVWNNSLPPSIVHGGDTHPTACGEGVQRGWNRTAEEVEMLPGLAGGVP